MPTAGTRPDAAQSRDAGAVDAGALDVGALEVGALDVGIQDTGPVDSGPVDTGPLDSGPLDSGLLDSGWVDAGPPDTGVIDSGPVVVCGDGILQGNETCDDGQTTDCIGTHDGGDGRCLPAGECAPDYLLDAMGQCVPTQLDATVIIDVDNFCNMTVTPAEITVPQGQRILVDWFNRSRDYPVDVWMSYGGGFIDLPTLQTWDEPISHCGGPSPRTEYADISTACSSVRFLFHCQ